MALTLQERHELLGGHASYQEIAQGVASWLVEPLVATEAARGRLRAWCEGGGLKRPARAREDIDEELVFLGDPGVRELVLSALARVAPLARDLALVSSIFVAPGRSTAGFISRIPIDAGHAYVIALHAGRPDCDVVSTAGHEVAHRFLHGVGCSNRRLREGDDTREALRLLRDAGELDVILEEHASREVTREIQADMLARAWGFHPPRRALKDRKATALAAIAERL